jgi:hypothetical protein
MPDIYDYARAVRELQEEQERHDNHPGLIDEAQLISLRQYVGHFTALILNGAPEPDAVVPVGQPDGRH